MLRVDLPALRKGPVQTEGAIPADDPLFAGVGFHLGRPVRVGGRLMYSGQGQYYWRADLRTVVETTCRRCLAPVALEVAADLDVLFTEDTQADDPSTYVIPPRSTELDLGATVREELILAVPSYVVCRDDCRGLCPRCGKDLNQGPCDCRPEADPRWGPLAALRARLARGED